MIVILASRHDPTAPALASRWAAQDAAVLTCSDLSTAGWHDPLADAGAGAAVIAGRRVGAGAIRAVLVRLPWVSEAELAHVVAEDRPYVAAEMSAFLVSWLSRLRCPVVNRPSPVGLNGPSWRPERWLHLAGRLGIPVRASRRQVVLGAEEPTSYEGGTATVTVVGDRSFGAEDGTLRELALRLATAAGMDLLDVHFAGPDAGAPLVGVNPLPDLSAPEVADAALECLMGGGTS
jgi:hypothetical protein